MSHKFKRGQLVRFVRTSLTERRNRGEVYEVVRLMPEDETGEPTYRIKSGMNERAVREAEIAAA